MFIFLIMVISCILLVYYFFCKKEKEEIESDEKSNESDESLIRKTSKSSDYILHFVINIKDSQSIVGENVIVSYKGTPLIKIINEYKPQTITNSIIWAQKNQGTIFIVICGGIIGYGDDKVLLRIPIQNKLIQGIDLHIVSTSSTLELYVDGKPQVFFRIGGMPMIVENIIQGKIVQDGSVGLSVSDDKPVGDVVESEFLPQMDELDFAVQQGAILKGNEIIKQLGRKYAK